MILSKNYILIFFALFAFICYQVINFAYFPVATSFPDELRYVNEVKTLVSTGEFWTGSDRAWEMPLTAIVFSVFYYISSNESHLIVCVRLLQSLFLILQAYLLYKMALKIFKDNISAILTFTGVLFYPFLIFYQTLLLSEILFITLLVVSFYYIYCWYEDDFELGKNFFLSNAFLILTIYSKGTLSFLPPLLLTAFYFLNKKNFSMSIKVLIYSVILYILFLSPWWIRNYSIFNQLIPFTTSSSIVLYLGNNSHNKSGGNSLQEDVDVDKYLKMISIKDEIERGKAFKKEALDFITNHPEEFFNLMYLKLKRFYNIVPNAPQYQQGYYKWISILSYGTIFTLFLVSLILHIRHFKKLSAIYMLFLYFTIIHMILIASLRYRLPLEPFMILLGSNVIASLYRRINANKN